MSTFSWDDEDQISEYDMIAEEIEEVEHLAAQHAQAPVVVEANEEEIEEILEEAAFDLNEEEANVVYNTRIRLEQARLYEMLINHNMFDGVDVDERAVAIVQNELKHYVVKRLEILMGLREPIIKEESPRSVFNHVEADFLRQLAAKGTKGRSLEVEEDEEEEPVKTGGLKPLTQRVKSSDLRPVARKKKVSPKQPPEPEVQIVEKPTNPRKKPVAKTKTKEYTTPKKTTRTKKKTVTADRQVIKSGLKPRDLRADEIEALAKEDMKQMEGRKPLHKMSAKEKAKMIAEVNARHPSRPKPETKVAPQLDENSLYNKYSAEQMKRAGSNSKANQFDTIMANLANNMAAKKAQEE